MATLSEAVKPAGVTFVRTPSTGSYCDQSNFSFWCWLFFLRTFITIFPTSQITSSSLLWKLCLPPRNYLINLLRERHLLSLVGFGVKHKWKITDHNVSAMFISTCIYLAYLFTIRNRLCVLFWPLQKILYYYLLISTLFSIAF